MWQSLQVARRVEQANYGWGCSAPSIGEREWLFCFAITRRFSPHSSRPPECKVLVLEHVVVCGAMKNRSDLQGSGNNLRSMFNRLSLAHRASMAQPIVSFGTLIRQPSAFLPIAMSLTALAIVLGSLASYRLTHETWGVVRETDEGAGVHLWQLLMAGQVPIIAFFAFKWLPRSLRQTLPVLALQAGAALASMAPVFFLKL
jgi:hypothetical protein